MLGLAMPLVAACDVATVPVVAPEPAPAPSVPAQREVGEPAPVASPTPTPAPRRPGAYANLDPDDDFVVGPPDPLPDCDAELDQAGVTYRASTLPVHQAHGGTLVCGAPQVVTYLRGPGHIAYHAPPLLTCSMALALASFERILQPEAERAFHSSVVRIDQLGTYNCREMAAYPGWVSEHAYANAIDISRFVLRDGRSIDVLHDFDLGESPPVRREGAFLRIVSQRANDEDVFSHVLTPFFDAHHKNHFHLDLARYRADGTRPATADNGP